MRVDLITISYCSLPVYLKSLSSTKTCVIDVDNDDIHDQRHCCVCLINACHCLESCRAVWRYAEVLLIKDQAQWRQYLRILVAKPMMAARRSYLDLCSVSSSGGFCTQALSLCMAIHLWDSGFIEQWYWWVTECWPEAPALGGPVLKKSWGRNIFKRILNPGFHFELNNLTPIF